MQSNKERFYVRRYSQNSPYRYWWIWYACDTAIREDNPEIVAAKEQGITILHRSDIVKAVLDVTDGIAVAGAHGKTSTTSMIGQILVEANADPTVIIGGEVDYLMIIWIIIRLWITC